MGLFWNNRELNIISLFEKGDALAMDKLYGEYADFLAKVCSRYISNQEDRHDVLQEAFIRIFTRIHTFEYRGKGSLKAWLTKIVINESLYFLRNNDPSLFTDKTTDIADSSTEDPDVDSMSITQITDTILKLPPGYRTVFNLYVIEGKSHKEIAELLNIKPDTSASQFHKARNMLAKMLKEQNKQN
ncbi:RNA polymerase sigma factor [Prevotella fusca]|uniref:RNA polymerase subunit sigma n=1 Tax=Prevotella fusca JCM 17724 TaxID=1236517 RepID=A0A0K1NNZ4_9BACT|nr:sigma-70 family RNA polymerase sigma factor [Prevotella fusca]AKU70603.1 RNA polymerase subunit sigma [Prevotella fusca JCM 17724]QUB85282.1 sigma-70 family RNA polymerase sigma factor [Prevotella fusca JCM 17724]